MASSSLSDSFSARKSKSSPPATLDVEENRGGGGGAQNPNEGSLRSKRAHSSLIQLNRCDLIITEQQNIKEQNNIPILKETDKGRIIIKLITTRKTH